MKYQPTKIEKKWQKQWREAGLYRVDLADTKRKYYLLVELPYPSGDLHMGHWFTFAVTDILGRMKRMQGYNVFFPVGFDAFGLPAENAAIKRGIDPKKWTYSNIEAMKKQFATMGGMHNFEHGVITCDSDYYRWNQWIFTKMFEKGLAYRGKTLSNWCPKDQTVLANENVEAGKCWRCGTEVVQKEVEQWMLKITEYADRLLWKEKPNFVLIHGFNGTPNGIFFPWLTAELKKLGYEVQVPQLPNADDPDIDEQVKYVLNNTNINENSIILGHSLGSVIALKVAESAKPRGMVIAAGFAQPKFKDNVRPFEDKFNWKFDFKKIRQNAGEVILLRAENDTAVYGERSDFIKEQIGGKIVDFKAMDDHITGEQEPEVLKALIALDPAREVDWPQSVREGQNSWIGKSEGIEINFPIARSVIPAKEGIQKEKFRFAKSAENWIPDQAIALSSRRVGDDNITVFTKFPETVFGVTFMVVAPEHPIVVAILQGRTLKRDQSGSDPVGELREYVEKAKKKNEMERMSLDKQKSGVFTGLYCTNLVNGSKVPIWVADYVIGGYGTGAVMGVPGSDVRDFDFAKKYDLPVVQVISAHPRGVPWRGKAHPGGEFGNESLAVSNFTRDDVLEAGFIVNSGQFDGTKTPDPAKEKFIDYLEQQGWGVRKINYHLHDWSISRQRYWGTPIPMVHCESCEKNGLSSPRKRGSRTRPGPGFPIESGMTGELAMPGWFPVPEDQLPVELPDISDYAPHGKPPLATAEDWVNVKCPNCGGEAKREVDTMDTFVDSAWYFLRYVDPKNKKEIFDSKKVNSWLPVELYVGGAEHTLGHTLYSRFFYKFLVDIGAIRGASEYALKRVHHGVILGPDGARMSKSKGNVVNPDEQVAQFGADAVRMYLAFMGPYDLVASWNPNGLRGVYHFLQRVWELGEQVSKVTEVSKVSKAEQLSAEDLLWMHKTIKKVTEDVSAIKYNTAVAALMEWLNYLSKKAHVEGNKSIKGNKGNEGGVTEEEYKTLLLLLAPFAPHMTEELWQEGLARGAWRVEGDLRATSIHVQSWPEFDQKHIKTESITIVVQVNGKVRDRLLVEANSDQKTVEKLALSAEKVQKFLGKEKPRKTIFVPGKLINFVV